jgi:hypothetical protein
MLDNDYSEGDGEDSEDCNAARGRVEPGGGDRDDGVYIGFIFSKKDELPIIKFFVKIKIGHVNSYNFQINKQLS